jgi:hypothetical protein
MFWKSSTGVSDGMAAGSFLGPTAGHSPPVCAACGNRRLIPALKNRLAWILKRMDENGYEIVEKGVANE